MTSDLRTCGLCPKKLPPDQIGGCGFFGPDHCRDCCSHQEIWTPLSMLEQKDQTYRQASWENPYSKDGGPRA
jgi:hypothetical protein